ncbi:MAG: bifunctional UDP-3-O-[3-hydroxymyristoyl] N-acetylglucosamine deacetylase/3-hydroxyacyl-ACP dehydratase [Puniceicoccaceae bacterium]
MNQRSIQTEASVSGKSLHTGEEVTLTLKPAPAGSGYIFRRTDLYGKPEVKADVALVTEVVRSTTIADGHAKVHTCEHILSALAGMGVDNALIEMDASEPPIFDGSAKEYVKLIEACGIVEQDEKRNPYRVMEPISVSEGDRSLIALPHDGLRITCTSSDDRGIHTQNLTIDIDPETYASGLAESRTFTIYEDIEELLKLGKIQGGSLDSAIVIRGDKIIAKEPLRYKDEFVRHKILDVIGDLALLGVPLHAHIIAIRPGHALNAQLTMAIREKMVSATLAKTVPPPLIKRLEFESEEQELDIRRILDILPHRYPFVMIDKVIDLERNRLVAVKNVSINEHYFQGHFPGRPVMPGVLQIEAMAQAAGILLLRSQNLANAIAFFMSCDKVKFRQAVVPGDQLIIKVELLKTRGNRIGLADAECIVGEKVVSSASLKFALIDGGSEP